MADPSLFTSYGGTSYAAVAAGAGTAAVVVSANKGRCCKVIVIATGTAAISIYDNASAASGTTAAAIAKRVRLVTGEYSFSRARLCVRLDDSHAAACDEVRASARFLRPRERVQPLARVVLVSRNAHERSWRSPRAGDFRKPGW